MNYRREVTFLVKGVSRRVIVIRSPDKKIFEEAIFIVNEDSYKEEGVTGEMIIKEAQTVADRYIKDNLSKRRLPKMPPLFYAALGAIVTGIVCIAANLLM